LKFVREQPRSIPAVVLVLVAIIVVAAVLAGPIASFTAAAAYLVVADTIDQASRASATVANVGVEITGATVAVDVKHEGTRMPDDVAIHLADQVGALGGTLNVDVSHMRAELPCAS
jgi:hypothetical protein